MKIKITCVTKPTTYFEFGPRGSVVRMPTDIATYLINLGVQAQVWGAAHDLLIVLKNAAEGES